MSRRPERMPPGQENRATAIGATAIRLALVVCLALGWAAVPASAGDDGCTVYATIGPDGKLIKTTRLEDIPAPQRDSLLTYRDCEQARALAARGGREIQAPPAAGPPTVGGPQPWPAPAAPERPIRLVAWFSGLPVGPALLLILCLAAAVAGQIGILVAAFRSHWLWGLGCLLLPLVDLVFVALHWDEAYPSFLVNLAGGLGTAAVVLWLAPLSA